MKNPQALLLVLASILTSAHAAVYHLDSIRGDDSTSGLSPALAWRSLEKANATVLKPGDQLLFKAGGRWSGQFTPKGGGDSVAMVLIGRYGEGPLPRIDGEGNYLDTVLLKNISFVEMADLEITNRGPKSAPWRTGINILADGSGKMQRVYLQRLYVHDVNGDLRKTHEGCGIFFEAKGDNSSHFDSLLIEQCRIERTDTLKDLFKRLGEWESSLETVPLWDSLPHWWADSARVYDTYAPHPEPRWSHIGRSDRLKKSKKNCKFRVRMPHGRLMILVRQYLLSKTHEKQTAPDWCPTDEFSPHQGLYLG